MGSSARVLVIGATGHLGRCLVMASVASKRPTFALVRPSTLLSSASDPAKTDLLESFRAAGVTILQGSSDDPSSLLKAIQQVDIVISALNVPQYMDELKILSAIQECGTIKRFVLFEYVVPDLTTIEPHEPLKSIFEIRQKIWSGVKESGVPFTHVITYGFASYYVASLGQLDCRSPPKDKVVIAANGDQKAYMVAEEDIATYTIKAADDERAINKDVHLRFPANHLSQNDMVSLWESKVGKSLEKVNESEEEMLTALVGTSSPSFIKALKHFAFAKGGHFVQNISPDGVEAVDLYPEVAYITVDQYLDRFL